MNKTAFIISVALTTFILLAVGGIAYGVRAAEKAQAAQDAPTALAAPETAAAGIDPALEQALNEREAAYQAMIADANTRLQQAQEQQMALQAQLAAVQAGTQAAAAPTSITPEQAATAASTFLGQTSIYSIELVSVQNTPMYLVTFSSGDIVYIDMNGMVAGSVPATQITQVDPGFSGGWGGEREHEHGEHEDHDD